MMDETQRGMITVILLCVTSAMLAGGQPIDVCGSCHANATCDDYPDGSGKVCNCKYGFVGNGRTICLDKDECQIGAQKICGHHTNCHNTYGSYFCTCLSGYHPSNNMDVFIPNDGTHCQDTDECMITGLCGDGGLCRNLEGSFECSCQLGYQVHNGPEPFNPHKHKSFCKDKDECQIGAQKICGRHTNCHNTYGSYFCTCLSGYHPSNNMDVFIPNDGTHCQDTDECMITGLCGDGGLCRNLEGSFECSCQLGYQVHNGPEPFNPHKHKSFCKVVDCGRPAAIEGMVLVSVPQTTYSSVAMFACDEGFVWKRGENSSVCGADGQWRRPTAVCEDVDCGSPPTLPNSHMLWNKSTRMGTEVHYWCTSGYHNVGNGNVSICTASGEWERPALLCQEILCGLPPIVEFTEQVLGSNSSPGSTVLYICKEGFEYKGGLNVSVCGENGQWTHPTLLCQEILCGDPPILPHTGRLWNGSLTPGSRVTYFCKTGFYHSQGNNISLCTIKGYWTKPDISCKEVDCGAPPPIPHAVMLWNNGSTVGSQIVHQCNSGYHNVGGGSVSVCRANGEWDAAFLLCQDISCGPPLNLPHTNLLWNGTSTPGSVVLYECMDGFYQKSGNNVSTCSTSGEWEDVSIKCEALCGPAPFLANSEVVWHNRSVVIYRCVNGYHSWRGSNVSVCSSSGVWEKASMKCVEIKPAVNHLLVINEKCVNWRAEKYEEDTEVYKVTYVGSRDYQRSFHDKRKQFVRSKADQLELCLKLLPVTNYSISITAMSAKFTASITTTTSLTVPPAPVIYYREFETPVPTLRLQRSHHTLDPLSLYQVFVVSVDQIMRFDCSSPASLHPSSRTKPLLEYITAQIEVRHVGTEFNFTVGNGLHYGGFLNAQLENGRNYYILLRAVSEWKMEIKSTCVLWAKVKGTSYVLMVSFSAAAALIVTIALIILGVYGFVWCFRKT
ncbi:sushi domain-containing protein 1 isoform X2 [Cheilinus undulatus]|uniref:sushi domain-containing protein 1 isoform X2 n=1 Tax=Cheilinus undulatus TaxID=241271 RepID=UPI001BD28B92|nr:sushi domain-containing protein 1 isoform X2 [Cheilinus undulatus]